MRFPCQYYIPWIWLFSAGPLQICYDPEKLPPFASGKLLINRANKKWESHFFEIDGNAILLKDMHLEQLFE